MLREWIAPLVGILTILGVLVGAAAWVHGYFATKRDVIDLADPVIENRRRVLNLEGVGPHDPERRDVEEWRRRIQDGRFER